MIKKTIRLISYGLVFVGLGAVQGCGGDDEKDLCYECTDLNGDTYDYCFDQFKSYYEGGTKDDFEDYIDEYIADGYDCKKK